jgi:DNA-directed RNA polymerase sigma subunit (sigma70/sigma32)
MARSLGFLTGGWPSDDGWPYPDSVHDGEIADDIADDQIDVGAYVDDDVIALHAAGAHLFDGLAPLELSVVTGRYGLDGGGPRTMRQLQQELGLPRAELRIALGDGLAKVRSHLG